MAGYVIHLAVGEEFLRNHPHYIKDYDSFIDGIIYPDSVEDKSLTHYGPLSSQSHLDKYFEERDILTDFDKGYFLHLVTDYLFYNKFLIVFNKKVMHNDYDLTNKEIEKHFNLKLPNSVKDNVFYKEGTPKILSVNETIEFIKETAKYNLEEIREAICRGDSYWLTIHVPDRYEDKDI